VIIGGALIVLGLFVLGWTCWFGGLAAVWVAWSLLVFVISADLGTYGGVDWSLDATSVSPGQPVHLTATNLFSPARPPWFMNHETWVHKRVKRRSTRLYGFNMEPTGVYWELRDTTVPDGSEPLKVGTVPSKFTLGPGETFVWAIDTTHLRPPMVLKVIPRWPQNDKKGNTTWIPWEEPLDRKIRLTPASPQTSSPGPQTVLATG
jgi:hypothetical protein